MKSGKLDWNDLLEVIKEGNSVKRDDVPNLSGVGEDCAVVRFGEYDLVLSTDPITGTESNMGRLAVNINCNDLASSGASPVGILVTILAPTSAELSDIKKIMHDIGSEASKYNLAILGGHTEVTDAVNRMVVSCTVVGKTSKNKSILTRGAKKGDSIIVSKYLCLEGTSIICSDYKEKLSEVLTEDEFTEAKAYGEELSVVKEGLLLKDENITSMHDITEGGVLGALWEVSTAAGLGFIVEEDKMPILSLTKKVCSFFKIDPLRLISSGSMLITTSDPHKIIKILESAGINGSIIGKMTEKDGILVTENEQKNVKPPKRDELFNI